jgi:hypothetical protein
MALNPSMKKKVYAQVHVFDCEKGEKREKWPLLGSRGFLRKIGFFGERIFDFMRAEFGNGTKNGRIDCFPCYDKR